MDLEKYEVAGLQLFPRDRNPGPDLLDGPSRQLDAVPGIHPAGEAGTIESRFGCQAAKPIGYSHLGSCRGEKSLHITGGGYGFRLPLAACTAHETEQGQDGNDGICQCFPHDPFDPDSLDPSRSFKVCLKSAHDARNQVLHNRGPVPLSLYGQLSQKGGIHPQQRHLAPQRRSRKNHNVIPAKAGIQEG